MEMVNVESSNIKAVGYDADAQEMVVHFTSGGKYRYSKVPADLHAQLMEAKSKGSFFQQHVVKRPDLFPFRTEV